MIGIFGVVGAGAFIANLAGFYELSSVIAGVKHLVRGLT